MVGTRPDWYIPNWAPRSSNVISALLVASSCVTSTTFGYDGSMLNGLNILPSYADYFHLNAATTGLMTASIWIGGIIAGVTFGKITDLIGRRPALFWAAVITLFAVLLQTAAQNIAMFVIARVFIGFGTTASGLAGPTWLAETFPLKRRAWGLGVFNDFYYVGGLIAAGITYKTATYNSTWAWRTPSLVQGIFSLICIIILPFVPESPRWLMYQGRVDDAKTALALTYADGDVSSAEVVIEFKQIEDAISFEKNQMDTLSVKELWNTKTARKRVLLAVSAAVFSTIVGNVAASYYLGPMLTNAGIKDSTKQLEINIILNAFCLVCALAGTYLVDKLGRKPTAIISTAALTIFIFMMGALTKVYGESTSPSGVYAAVGSIFLFQGSYSIGWTPLLYLYPPEVLHYPIRANGMGVFQIFLNGTALLFVFIMPIALENIGWKLYFINGSWDVIILVIVLIYWIETKDKTLEEIDMTIEGRRYGSASAGNVPESIEDKDVQIIAGK